MPSLQQIVMNREPTWFRLRQAIPLAAALLGLPAALQLHWVHFTRDGLEFPDAEPIGIMGGRSGNRSFLWQQRYWVEYDLNWRLVEACPQLRQYVATVRQPSYSGDHDGVTEGRVVLALDPAPAL